MTVMIVIILMLLNHQPVFAEIKSSAETLDTPMQLRLDKIRFLLDERDVSDQTTNQMVIDEMRRLLNQINDQYQQLSRLKQMDIQQIKAINQSTLEDIKSRMIQMQAIQNKLQSTKQQIEEKLLLKEQKIALLTEENQHLKELQTNRVDTSAADNLVQNSAVSDNLNTAHTLTSGLTVYKFKTVIHFPSRKFRLSKKQLKQLDQIAATAKQYPDHILQVIGHTDVLPIAKENKNWMSSNWELSAARAAAVVLYLQHGANISPLKIQLLGAGQYQPVNNANNDEAHRHNRRIELQLVPEPTHYDIKMLDI